MQTDRYYNIFARHYRSDNDSLDNTYFNIKLLDYGNINTKTTKSDQISKTLINHCYQSSIRIPLSISIWHFAILIFDLKFSFLYLYDNITCAHSFKFLVCVCFLYLCVELLLFICVCLTFFFAEVSFKFAPNNFFKIDIRLSLLHVFYYLCVFNCLIVSYFFFERVILIICVGPTLGTM